MHHTLQTHLRWTSLVACILLASCGPSNSPAPPTDDASNEPTVDAEQPSPTPPDEHAGHATSSPSEGLTLSLNDGNKWQMDDHTRDMFMEMSQRFDDFDAAHASQDQLTELGTTLKGDLDVLIAGCTMVGAAHDELHKYLMEYMPAVNALSNSGQLDDAKVVHGLLGAYPEFFE